MGTFSQKEAWIFLFMCASGMDSFPGVWDCMTFFHTCFYFFFAKEIVTYKNTFNFIILAILVLLLLLLLLTGCNSSGGGQRLFLDLCSGVTPGGVWCGHM